MKATRKSKTWILSSVFVLFVVLFAVAVAILIWQRDVLYKNIVVIENGFKKYNLQIHLAEKVRQINNFSKNQVVIDSLQEYEKTGEISDENLKLIDAEFKEFGWVGSSLLNKNGVVVDSAFKEEVGLDYSSYTPDEIGDNPFFLVYYDQFLRQDILEIVDPVIIDGKMIGAVSADVDLVWLKGFAMSPTEYQSKFPLETYIIDDTGLFLTPSKYISADLGGGLLAQRAKDEILQKCSELLNESDSENKSSNDVIQYVNYLGDNAIGAISSIPEANWCLITEYK